MEPAAGAGTLMTMELTVEVGAVGERLRSRAVTVAVGLVVIVIKRDRPQSPWNDVSSSLSESGRPRFRRRVGGGL